MKKLGDVVSRRTAVQGMAGLVAGSLGTIGVIPSIPRTEDSIAPIPAASFREINNVSRSEILSYARSVAFNDSHEAADTDRLYDDSGATLVLGPIATIAPAAGVLTTPENDVASGRIMAHIYAEGDWPKLNLFKGENYVWFDARHGILRALIIPEQKSRPILEFTVKMMPNKITYPHARFRYDVTAKSSSLWVSCMYGCCEVGGPQGPTGPSPNRIP